MRLGLRLDDYDFWFGASSGPSEASMETIPLFDRFRVVFFLKVMVLILLMGAFFFFFFWAFS